MGFANIRVFAVRLQTKPGCYIALASLGKAQISSFEHVNSEVQIGTVSRRTPPCEILGAGGPFARADAQPRREARMLLGEREITQPFKQAHCEVYILTPAEEETEFYSNRFAAHFLKQHQLNALARQRGWATEIYGAFDSDNTPPP
jgi:hypothetical protein